MAQDEILPGPQPQYPLEEVMRAFREEMNSIPKPAVRPPSRWESFAAPLADTPIINSARSDAPLAALVAGLMRGVGSVAVGRANARAAASKPNPVAQKEAGLRFEGRKRILEDDYEAKRKSYSEAGRALAERKRDEGVITEQDVKDPEFGGYKVGDRERQYIIDQRRTMATARKSRELERKNKNAMSTKAAPKAAPAPRKPAPETSTSLITRKNRTLQGFQDAMQAAIEGDAEKAQQIYDRVAVTVTEGDTLFTDPDVLRMHTKVRQAIKALAPPAGKKK